MQPNQLDGMNVGNSEYKKLRRIKEIQIVRSDVKFKVNYSINNCTIDDNSLY